jgi:hypothetical protein
MIPDIDLERSTLWTPKAAADIGGPVVNGKWVPPTLYTVTPATDADEWMHVNIAGTSWTCMLASLIRPILPYHDPAAILFTQVYDLMTDANAPGVAQAIETTNRVNIAGTDYICGGQFNYAIGGQFQVYTKANPWANTGIIPGKFAPNTPYRVKIRNVINSVAKTWSVLAVTINGLAYSVPAACQNVPGIPLPWPDGAYDQKQLDFNQTAGKMQVSFRRVSNQWE